MTKSNRKSNRNGRRRNGNVSSGPSRAPQTTLKRTFRRFIVVKLNNVTGSGDSKYCYYSKYLKPQLDECAGFKDAQQTFEFWRLNRFRIRAQPGYNEYNQSYNTINLDALAAMQMWTAADFGMNEGISGVDLLSYNNAKCHTLSLNGIKTIVNTSVRANLKNTQPLTILSPAQWLDTSTDCSTVEYSGAQLFFRMQGQDTTNYMPRVQLILEYDVEFKHPAYQNRPDTFESSFIGSTLLTIPDGSQPDQTREYVVTAYTLNDSGNNVRLERSDGQAGSLDYTASEFYTVYLNQTSGKYFTDRKVVYTGPVPRRPLDYVPPV